MATPFKKVLLSIFLVMISACATMTDAQREREELYMGIQKVADQAQACYNQLSNDQKHAMLYANFALKRKPATQTELNNPAHVSDEMVRLILDWYALHQQCDNAMLSGFGRLDGRLEIVAIKWLQDRARLLERIITARPTYGQINAELDVLKVREANEYKEWLARAELGFSRRHADEVTKRDRVSQQRQDAFLSTASKVASVLFEALADLATIQVALAVAQQQYAATHPVYVPIQPIQPRISNTSCSQDFRGGFSCTHY
ncbi:MAG: hypothetical protein Q8L15_17575 [Methylobacter sp.]|nr:hypothetical protein [Methylobacter sp.]